MQLIITINKIVFIQSPKTTNFILPLEKLIKLYNNSNNFGALIYFKKPDHYYEFIVADSSKRIIGVTEKVFN